MRTMTGIILIATAMIVSYGVAVAFGRVDMAIGGLLGHLIGLSILWAIHARQMRRIRRRA